MANEIRKKNPDLRSLLAPYIAKWYYFAISLVIFGIFGFFYAKSRQKEYQVNANVLITQEGSTSKAAFGNLESLFDVSSDVDDEIFLLASHSAYRTVIEEKGLNISHYVHSGFMKDVFYYKDYPVQVYPAPGIADTLHTTLKFNVEVSAKGSVDLVAKDLKNKIAVVKNGSFPITVDTPYGQFVIDKTEYFEPGKKLETQINVLGYHPAAELLEKDIKSSIANKRAHVISLSYKTTCPEYGEDLLNYIVDEYNRRGIEQNNLQNLKTADFIDQRLVLLSKDLKDSEATIQQYKEQTGLNNVQMESQYNYTRKGTSYAQLVEAQTQAELLRMALDFINNPENAYQLIPSTINDSEGLKSAVDTYNQLILRRIAMQGNAKEGNLALKQLSDQIDAMRAGIQTTLTKAISNTEVSIADLQKQVKLAERDLNQIPGFEREIVDLYRERSVKQELYVFLLKRREETAMFIANALPKAQIIDEAYRLTRPVNTSRKMIFLAFLMAGCAIPFGLIYLLNLLRNKFESREEVERLTNVPILGEISTDRTADPMVVANRSHSSVAELFRLMRTNLQFILNDASDKVVLVTSTNPGEGKSYISTNLAASLALLGKRVLLIGLDIRKPRLQEYLNISSSKGVTQYLSTPGMDISDIIIRDAIIPNLDVIVAGPIPPNPAELLASQEVDALFENLREMYDYIIVDTAPAGMVSDTFTLNRVADATIYVTRVNITTLRDIDFINSINRDKRLRKLSIVVNGTTPKKTYGYGENPQK